MTIRFIPSFIFLSLLSCQMPMALNSSNNTNEIAQRNETMLKKKDRRLNAIDFSLGAQEGKSYLQTFMDEFDRKAMENFEGLCSVIAIVHVERDGKISHVSTEGPNKKFNTEVEKTIMRISEKNRKASTKLNERQRVVLPLTIQF